MIKHLLSVVLVPKLANSTETAMNRVAQVKNTRQVSQFQGGLTSIDSKTIIKTTEDIKTKMTTEESRISSKEQSIGFAKAMEVLTTIDSEDGLSRCYLFLSPFTKDDFQ